MWASQQPEFWEPFTNGEELYEAFKDTPRRGVWYSVWNHKTLDVGPRNDLDIERLYRVVLEIEKAVENEVYVPSVTASSCIWCPYTNLCPAVIPLAEEVEIARRERYGN